LWFVSGDPGLPGALGNRIPETWAFRGNDSAQPRM